MSDIINELEILISKIHQIKLNLKKSPQRKYLKFTLDEKVRIIRNTYNNIIDLLAKFESSIESNHFNFLIKAARLEFDEANNLLQSKLKNYKKKLSWRSVICSIIFINSLKNTATRKNLVSDKIVKMPSVDIKLGTALVNTYDGSPAQLNAFLDAVALFVDTVDAAYENATPAEKNAARATVVRFIRTRLTGAARQFIGELNDLQEILDELKLRCASKATSDSIVAKLKATKQITTTDNFCDVVEKLTNELKSAYLNEKIPTDTADKMATKRGVEALIGGIKNPDTKLILKAGNFSKFDDAVQKLQENDVPESSSSKSQVLYVRNYSNNRIRGRGYSTRGSRPRGRQPFNNDRYYGNYFSNQNRGNFNNNWRGGNQRTRGRDLRQSAFYAQALNPNQNMQQIHPPSVQPATQSNFQQPHNVIQNGNIHPLGVPLGQHTQ